MKREPRNYEVGRRGCIRSCPPEVFLGTCVLKISSKFAGEHPCRSAISIQLQRNVFEILLWHGCFPVNLLHNFGTPFPKKASGGLLLMYLDLYCKSLLVEHWSFWFYFVCFLKLGTHWGFTGFYRYFLV